MFMLEEQIEQLPTPTSLLMKGTDQSLGGLEAEFRSVLQTHTEHPVGATHCTEGKGDIEKS